MPEQNLEENESIESLAGFVKFLEGCDEDEMLFRGQREDFPLLPKIARESLKLRYGTPVSEESKIFEMFKRESVPLLEHSQLSECAQLVIAQHHGLPTRLLDWTLNPLAALWFAVCKPAKKEKDGVVWVLRAAAPEVRETTIRTETKRMPFKHADVRVYCPSHVVTRLVAQSGWFTIHGLNKERTAFCAFEDSNLLEHSRKLLIPAKCFMNIRDQLDRCGINEKTLFPDLDGLCGHIQWYHTHLRDEERKS